MHYNSTFVLSMFEMKFRSSSIDNVSCFCVIRAIYDKLKTGVRSEDDKQMIDQRIDEIATNARFCQYKSGDKNAAKELRNLRTKAALDDPEMTRVLDVRLLLLLIETLMALKRDFCIGFSQ